MLVAGISLEEADPVLLRLPDPFGGGVIVEDGDLFPQPGKQIDNPEPDMPKAADYDPAVHVRNRSTAAASAAAAAAAATPTTPSTATATATATAPAAARPRVAARQ